MLVEAVNKAFSKYIYARHHHDWQFDRNSSTSESVGKFSFTNTVYIFKCACGKVKVLEAIK